MSDELVNAGLEAKKVTAAGGRTDGAYDEMNMKLLVV